MFIKLFWVSRFSFSNKVEVDEREFGRQRREQLGGSEGIYPWESLKI